jgi:formimidoylglutamate deiminase
LIHAAAETGIRITLIPVFYQKGGFGKDPQSRQRRFISKTTEDYFRLLEASKTSVTEYERANLGFSVHSLRAVDANDIIATFQQGPKNIPFHLHAAEQLKEIEDCLAYLKQRPVEWVLNNLPADDRFHLVHCTHMNYDEVTRLAKSGAYAVLCPGTEGNLGDGIFRLTDFAAEQGSWSIGTDSHISLNPLEDLRWLDYAQRFTTHKRNTFDNGAARLVNMTWRAGRRAMGFSDTEFFTPGSDLDAVIFDASAPLFTQRDTTHLLPAILYTADSSDIYGTMVGGKWVVKEQRHAQQRSIRTKFVSAIRSIEF